MGVLKLVDRDGLLINYEQFVPNLMEESGDPDSHHVSDVIEAFMHFTWKASNRRFLVSSVKRAGNYLICWSIQSVENLEFGAGMKSSLSLNLLM